MTEKLKLVTSFSQLKAGDLVVVKPCGHCGGTHRGILVGFGVYPSVLPDGMFNNASGWSAEPRGQCPKRTNRIIIGAERVGRREVYLVDTGLEQSHSTERRKELAR